MNTTALSLSFGFAAVQCVICSVIMFIIARKCRTGTFRRNEWAGFRTAATLASPEVFTEVHRRYWWANAVLGGSTMVMAVLFAIYSLAAVLAEGKLNPTPLIIAVLVLAAGTLAFALWVGRRVNAAAQALL